MEWTRIETAKGTSCRVLTGGPGGAGTGGGASVDPVVFFHDAGGLREPNPFLDRLAERYQVFAPELPGYGESTGEELLEDMLDFALHGWDVVDALGLERPRIVAHSMGGMIAAEMACLCPQRAQRLALIAPGGMWLDDHPIPDIFATLPHHLPELLFADPAKGAAALTRGADFSDPEALVAFFIDNARRLGTAGKILFPIPNRRLSKRIYRLTTPTLLVWGEEDRLIPPVYADRWLELLPSAELVTVADAGHAATIEQPDAVADAILKFLEA
ncbi:MAG TPA: alpha/beta fold hydrolase [Acidimicrobiales bacterium]|nr:alpha/beta fold hydrolase [Acidimicrobiales bacterium]